MVVFNGLMTWHPIAHNKGAKSTSLAEENNRREMTIKSKKIGTGWRW